MDENGRKGTFMIENNREVYYCLKQDIDYFDRPVMNVLFNQDNGPEYVILYNQLCLLTLESHGYLVSKIGKKFFPFTEKMIAGETKYHSEEFVRKALDLFMELDLIKTGYNGYMYIPEAQESIEIISEETEDDDLSGTGVDGEIL